MQPHVILSVGLRQGSCLCSSSSRKYPGTEGTIRTTIDTITADMLQRTNSIIVLMFVESKGCTYRAPVRYVTKTWSVVPLNKKIHILLSQVYCVWQVVKTPTIILNNPVYVCLCVCSLWRVWFRTLFQWAALQWLRRLVLHVSPRRPGLDPSWVHVGFVSGIMLPVKVFLRIPRSVPLSLSFH
jgi:hypothetical protein